MMNNNSTKPQLVDEVLRKLKSDRVRMKPKAHFILKTLLVASGVIILTLFALYLISFIAFTLRVSGVWFLPGFGFHGMGILFTSMPWLLILTAVFLIIVLEILVKHFSFAYRRPILYSTLAIIIVVLLGSFFINKTPFHRNLFQQDHEGRLPFAGGFYRNFGMPKSNDMHRGVVSEIIDGNFSLENPEGQIITVIVNSKTRFPFGTGISEGDAVMVLGREEGGAIEAFGVSKIDDDFKFFKQNHTFKPNNMLLPHRTPIMPGR